MTPADTEEKVRRLEARIAELRTRWPSHSVPPRMWEELEELESALEALNETARTDVASGATAFADAASASVASAMVARPASSSTPDTRTGDTGGG